MDSHALLNTSPRFGWSPQNDFLPSDDLGSPLDTPKLDIPMPDNPLMDHDGAHRDGLPTEPANQPPRTSVALTVAQTVVASSRRRSRYRQLNWDRQKARLKTLYLDENKTLKETMSIMKDKYSFVASEKLYKERLKQWGRHKNLPVPIAEFMAGRAKERRRKRGRETVFTYGELLCLYQKLNTVRTYASAFEDTHIALNRIWWAYEWHKERFQCIETMEAYMQVVANILKGGYEAVAIAQFRQVANKAESLFMFNDERAVWINITIGLVFQTHMTWDDAEEWFDRAYAGALASTKWSIEDGIVSAPENARNKRHFSYISDEGRPFKTIFGISGITICPGRLHLE
ncbi:hypothetical protein QQZ08_010937 [Neonectria magnoliae]|uniref:Clr5 domain-containing protein n=1 Tax=Neonectria magnoliae TaxID=2732573 RepID=A0ABR1HE61_9HYPO